MSFTKTVFIIKDIQSPKHPCNNYLKLTPQKSFQSIGLLHQIKFGHLRGNVLMLCSLLNYVPISYFQNYSIYNCVFWFFTSHAFLAKETLIKLIVIYLQYLLSHNTCKKCNAEHLSYN